jgi:hypothetical protein
MSARENVLMTMAYSSEWFLGTHEEALAQHRKELDDYRAEVLREAAESLRGFGMEDAGNFIDPGPAQP